MTQKTAKKKFQASSGTQKITGTRRDQDYNEDKNKKSSSKEKTAVNSKLESKRPTEIKLMQEVTSDQLISMQWEQNDKQRREEAMLLQQGSVRYTSESKAQKPHAEIIDEDK